MSTGIDQVIDSPEAQEFWLRRLVAFIIDSLIIWVPITIIFNVAWALGYYHQGPWLAAGALVIIYTALFEAELGYTIGKRIMNLEVVSLDTRLYDMQRALIRNITKIHPVLLVIDILAGMLGENRPNMRYLDFVVKAEVVDTQVAEWRRGKGMAPPPAGEGKQAAVSVQSDEAPPEPTMPPAPAEEAAPEPPDEDVLEEVTEEEARPTGIAPPPVPPAPPSLPDDENVVVEEEEEG